ncbi:hypothetical protein VTJ04DRAFT_547 [Mycothermus thermophilus]|uniref:uncharacterized protein n=1 Tax=Humicola insolens TaxID=85995 RepID=UPI0037434656
MGPGHRPLRPPSPPSITAASARDVKVSFSAQQDALLRRIPTRQRERERERERDNKCLKAKTEVPSNCKDTIPIAIASPPLTIHLLVPSNVHAKLHS